MSGKSQAILQFEQQVEMMDTVFMRYELWIILIISSTYPFCVGQLKSCSKNVSQVAMPKWTSLIRAKVSVWSDALINSFPSLNSLEQNSKTLEWSNNKQFNKIYKWCVLNVTRRLCFHPSMDKLNEKLVKWSNDPRNIEKYVNPVL